MTDKPAYRVPLMTEIETLPSNGLNVISTFSGAGGSCLGFKLAGFNVRWASEFIPAAQDVYRRNHKGTLLDTRDIRQVTPEMILEATGLKAGDVDVLEGSPPCASFSMAGSRAESWGTVKKYSDTEQRVDDLFFEYTRLLKGLQPKVFVAENVAGLLRGVAKGYFKEIMRAMKACGYKVEARLLDAQWLGVPQSRQRVIFIGVREDLELSPAYPTPLSFRYTVRDALPEVLRHGTAPPHADWVEADRDLDSVMVDSDQAPSPTILQSGPNKGVGFVDARVIHDTGGLFSQGDITDKPSPAVTVGSSGKGGGAPDSGHWRVETYIDPDTGADLDIGNYAIGPEWEKLKQGETSDRYFNLVKADENQPSPAVTALANAYNMRASAGVTHPTERRKFYIHELKRICAFPDDFELTGTYAQQWERLGRSVPPVMMWHVARVIRDELLFKLDGREAWPHDPDCLPKQGSCRLCAESSAG